MNVKVCVISIEKPLLSIGTKALDAEVKIFYDLAWYIRS